MGVTMTPGVTCFLQFAGAREKPGLKGGGGTWRRGLIPGASWRERTDILIIGGLVSCARKKQHHKPSNFREKTK